MKNEIKIEMAVDGITEERFAQIESVTHRVADILEKDLQGPAEALAVVTVLGTGLLRILKASGAIKIMPLPQSGKTDEKAKPDILSHLGVKTGQA